jgi:preprotein translocase subunit SecA
MFQEMMYDTNKETIKKVFRTNLVKTDESSISTSASIPTNLKKSKENSPNLGFVSPPTESQRPQPGLQNFSQPPSNSARTPIVNQRKIGSNEKVTIRKGDEVKEIKWKKAQDLVESGEWILEE